MIELPVKLISGGGVLLPETVKAKVKDILVKSGFEEIT